MKIATSTERLTELFDSDPRNDSSIARSLGVSRQSVSSWRAGVRSPKKTVLFKICDEYNVSIDWLMGFDVPRKGEEPQNRGQLKEYVGSGSGFVKLVDYMSQEDYMLVLDAFRRAEAKMREVEDGQIHP